METKKLPFREQFLIVLMPIVGIILLATYKLKDDEENATFATHLTYYGLVLWFIIFFIIAKNS